MPFDYTKIPVDAVAITPSDTTALSLCGVYVGGAGNLVVTTVRGNDVTFNAVPVGTQIMMAISKVKVATTATLIVGFKSE